MYTKISTALDRDLIISNEQHLDSTAHTPGLNEIDLGGIHMGLGKSIRIVLNVTALIGTLDVYFAHKTSESVAYTDNTITLFQISATGQYHVTLPQDCSRYINLFYTAGTSATVTAWLVNIVKSN